MVLWHTGTDCTCLRPRRRPRRLAATRESIHDQVGLWGWDDEDEEDVWDEFPYNSDVDADAEEDDDDDDDDDDF